MVGKEVELPKELNDQKQLKKRSSPTEKPRALTK